MLTMIPGGWLSDKVGERVGIASGMILMAGALFLLINIPQGNQLLYFVGWGMAGVGVGVMSPAYQSLISKAVPQHLRGTAFGLFSTSLGVVSLPAPWIGAQLWERFSPQFPFTITAIALLLSVIPIWIKFRLPKDVNQPTTEETINEESAVMTA
ncbi:MAG: MFS transporter [Anaerolineales bacterium]